MHETGTGQQVAQLHERHDDDDDDDDLIYRVSQEECAKLREDVPYVKLY